MYAKVKDIAKRAGVSSATVSRVLSKSAPVSEERATKVWNVQDELDYYPNFTARNLRRGTTTTVGFILPNVASSFFGKMAFAIEAELRKKNHDLVIYNTERNKDLELRALKVLISQKVVGIIFAPINPTNVLASKIRKVFKIPLVVVDNKLKDLQVPAVLHEDLDGARKLTSHLISHGHRKIAFLGGPLIETSCSRRLEGYKKALAENDIPLSEHLIKTGRWGDVESGLEMTRQLLELNEKPPAIFSANTYTTVGSLLAFQEKKIKVPEDVALVSFDNLEFCSVLNPPLTTLTEANIKIGKTAARLLLKWIKTGNFDSKEILIGSEIVVRESCGCTM